jgi:hypothetical protein
LQTNSFQQGLARRSTLRRGATATWIATVLVVLNGLSRPLAGQPAVIRITAPTAGTVVTPGQQFTVTVSVTQGAFDAVFVSAKDLETSTILSNPPYAFSFVVPSGFSGPLTLTAVGAANGGTMAFSQPVVLSVEKPILPNSLTTNPTLIAFLFAGEQRSIRVAGAYADGSTVDLTQSPKIEYTSMDATVVQIGNDRIITAVGAGTTQVNVSYGTLQASIRVSVPKTIRGDLSGDGQVDQDDLNLLLDSLNQPAVGPFDARDLNHDGKIDALDSRVLTTLCTFPRCASHK